MPHLIKLRSSYEKLFCKVEAKPHKNFIKNISYEIIGKKIGKKTNFMQTFNEYSFSKPLKEALQRLHYKKPTAVQAAVFNAFFSGQDLSVQAQTGSGKTLAYTLPICEKIEWEGHEPQAIILVPTRELALQIQEAFFKVGRFKRIKAVGLYGKAPFQIQQKELKQKTHVVIATPGRLLEHIEKGTILLEQVRFLVIDEADEMLKMGFLESVKAIKERLPKERQTLLFSATFPKAIENLAYNFLVNPQNLTITPEKVVNHQIEVKGYAVDPEEKREILLRLTKVMNPDCCMIFCNRKAEVEALYQVLKNAGYRCNRLHGDLEQRDRFNIMKDFKKGCYRYLVCTDVAARGIDVKQVTYVVSYDVPEDKEQYVHRVGRTGRGGKLGQAAMLITPDEEVAVRAIEEYIGEKLELAALPTKEAAAEGEQAFFEKMNQSMESMEDPQDEAIHEGILKLHINAGKKTKMRPVDVVGTLCNLPGMNAEDIGIIQVQDISTYVEILNGKGEKVYKLLQSTPIKGRMRKVSKVERR